ncbi:hypothetical protein [Halosaccharopolyspora lacisalsi]|uniref:hypothetical protein n=1 Tax=Halosaccharopolyspora lacisalsi TaxID=1000566 RepID=UPI0015FCF289|nr:hypothetical protein [Halosaccharopolyspora lacisalsi]
MVKKPSISLDEEVADKATQAAERDGMSLSAWLSRAAEQAAGRDAARAAVQEYFEEFGEPDAETVAAVEHELEQAGFWQPPAPDHEQKRLAAPAMLSAPFQGTESQETEWHETGERLAG